MFDLNFLTFTGEAFLFLFHFINSAENLKQTKNKKDSFLLFSFCSLDKNSSWNSWSNERSTDRIFIWSWQIFRDSLPLWGLQQVCNKKQSWFFFSFFYFFLVFKNCLPPFNTWLKWKLSDKPNFVTCVMADVRKRIFSTGAKIIVGLWI